MGVLVLAAACVGPADTALVDSALDCDIADGCLRNAASLGDGKIFDAADLGPDGVGGAANSGGYWIQSVKRYGQTMSLEIAPDELDELVGRIGTMTYKASDLIPMTIRVTNGVHAYDLRLDDADRTLWLWVPERVVTSYTFTVLPVDEAPGEDKAPLCKGESGAFGAEWNYQKHRALIFRGDRYNAVTKDIDIITDTWVNIACAATAAAKMHMLRHTEAGSTPAGQPEPGWPAPLATTLNERQAMLRMLTADYCGGGDSYTADGTKLRYADRKGWFRHGGVDLGDPDQRARLEAIWNERGAVCLDTPRLFPRDEIACAGTTRRCKPDDVARWRSRGHVVSVNF
jgi:hypothetical protein